MQLSIGLAESLWLVSNGNGTVFFSTKTVNTLQTDLKHKSLTIYFPR